MPRTNTNPTDRSVLVNEDFNQQQFDQQNDQSTLNYHEQNPENSNSLDESPVVPLPASQQMRRILNSDNLPHDKKRRVQWAFLLIGIASLLPWNFLITPMDYWNYKFRNVSDNETGDFDDTTGHTHNKTEIQTFFASYLSIASNVPFLLMLMLNSVVGQHRSQDFRTIFGLSAILVMFLFTTVFVEINTDSCK